MFFLGIKQTKGLPLLFFFSLPENPLCRSSEATVPNRNIIAATEGFSLENGFTGTG